MRAGDSSIYSTEDRKMYSLAKLKTPKSSQGVGIYADLMRDGEKVATIADEGEGGAMVIDYVSGAEQKAFIDFAVEAFEHPVSDFGAVERLVFGASDNAKAEYWINLTVDKALTAKKFDRQSRKSTIYRVEGESSWFSVSVPYGERVRELLEQSHGAGRVIAVWGAWGDQTI